MPEVASQEKAEAYGYRRLKDAKRSRIDHARAASHPSFKMVCGLTRARRREGPFEAPIMVRRPPTGVWKIQVNSMIESRALRPPELSA